MKKIEKNFFVLLPDSLIKVLRVKMVEDGYLDRPLPIGQLMFIGAIVGLSKEKGYCYATNTNKTTNSGLSELTTLPVKTIEAYIHALEEDEILYRYYFEGQRRIKINSKLVEKYPEITKDIFQQEQAPKNKGDDPKNKGDDPKNKGDDPKNKGDDPRFKVFTYYIYKLKESITKLKENKNKNFWLVNLEDEDFKKWVEENPLDYEQSQKDAFDAISNIYPVKAKTKEARGAFDKLDESELIELFESMPMLLDHVAKQKEQNLLASEHEFKYIEKFVNYISKKSFKNYQKKFREGRVFGNEAFEAFLERVEEYAYEMDADGFFIPIAEDEHYDFEKLKVIVWNCKHGKPMEELRPFCSALTGFKEEEVA